MAGSEGTYYYSSFLSDFRRVLNSEVKSASYDSEEGTSEISTLLFI
jgi:hypothetical protein